MRCLDEKLRTKSRRTSGTLRQKQRNPPTQLNVNRKKKFASYCKVVDTVLDATADVDAVVVDGVHDRETLRRIGFMKPAYTRSKYTYTELADRVAKKFEAVAVLTDFDAEGDLANQLITALLEERAVKVCKVCRDSIGAALKEVDIATIEGIYRLII
jgi:5S rRNA maturation endonuclease (ribonuclease M5)